MTQNTGPPDDAMKVETDCLADRLRCCNRAEQGNGKKRQKREKVKSACTRGMGGNSQLRQQIHQHLIANERRRVQEEDADHCPGQAKKWRAAWTTHLAGRGGANAFKTGRAINRRRAVRQDGGKGTEKHAGSIGTLE